MSDTTHPRCSHPAPRTRRDFLAQGLLSSAAYFLAPSLLTAVLRQRSAFASGQVINALSTDSGGMLPFLTIDCVGGAALPANFLVGDERGNILSLASAAYSNLGFNPNDVTLQRDFGVTMAGPSHANPGQGNVSKILEGLVRQASPQALAGLSMGVICTQTGDDQPHNLTNASHLVAQGGLRGRVIQPIGTEPTTHGGNSKGPFDASLTPLAVGSAFDLMSALSYGPGLANLTPDQVTAMAKATESLSQVQAARFNSLTLGDQFKTLTQSALHANVDLARPQTGIDPREDLATRAVYGLPAPSDPNFDPTTREARFATIVKNVLDGNCGPGTLAIGGCDYHNATESLGAQVDMVIGKSLGEIVELAYRKGQPCVIAMITDGGCTPLPGTRNWITDGGTKSLAVFALYQPGGRVRLARTQLGFYSASSAGGSGEMDAAADSTTLVGQNTENVARAIFVNYMAACGKLGDVQRVIGDSLTAQQIQNDILMLPA